MTTSELLIYIRDEVAKAELDNKKDAVNMYLVVKYADQLRSIAPIEFVTTIGRKESYVTEFRKGLKLAEIIADKGL